VLGCLENERREEEALERGRIPGREKGVIMTVARWPTTEA
jgi:hypothetical protein